MGSILIRGGTIVTMDPARPVLEDGWLTIEGQRIAALGAGPPPARPAADTIEAAGKIVMPGLVNAHLHTRPGRAMGDGLSHIEWHHRYADGYSAGMTPDDAYAGALLAFGECLKAGTTCVLPMPVLSGAVGRAAEDVHTVACHTVWERRSRRSSPHQSADFHTRAMRTPSRALVLAAPRMTK